METLTQACLTLQCEMIPGITRGVVVRSSSGEVTAVAHWPDATAVTRALISIARKSLRRGRAVAHRPEREDKQGICYVAVPLSSALGRPAALAIELDPSVRQQPRGIVELMSASADVVSQVAAGDLSRSHLSKLLRFVGVCLESDTFDAAAPVVATELAALLSFDRVSIGWLRRGHMQVAALSHSARFDDRVRMLRDIGLAMDESADQDATIVHPAPTQANPKITRRHEALCSQHESGAVCTTPIVRDGEIVGAICFERAIGEHIDTSDARLCEDVTALIGPLLLLRREADAGPVQTTRSYLRRHWSRLSGRGHPAFKIGTAALLSGLLALNVVRVEYLVRAEATLEGRVQRAIVASVDGYVAESYVRAGDSVEEGQLIARLDERDLQLEERKLAGRREQLRREHREALAAGERTQVTILGAKAAQAEAQLDMVREQLDRTQLIAPFAGIVVKGDLSRSLGSPVQKGDVLFEITPLDGYRVILKIDERQISRIVAGARGQMVLSAMPGQRLRFTVDRVTPVATAEDGLNYFRAEAHLDQPIESLRPGMEGVAKIKVDHRSVAWIWSHGLVERLSFAAWKWLP